MRTANASDPLEWMSVIAFAALGIGTAALLASSVAEILLVCALVWSTVVVAVGPRELLPDRITTVVTRAEPDVE